MENNAIVPINLESPDMEKLIELAQKANKTTPRYLGELIREKTSKLTECETTVTALELVWSQLSNTDNINQLKSDIAADLLTARMALELAKNNKLDLEQVKKWAIELFT